MVDKTTRGLLIALIVVIAGLAALQWWPSTQEAELPSAASTEDGSEAIAVSSKPLIEEVIDGEPHDDPASIPLTEESNDAIKAEIADLESRVEDLALQAADAEKLHEMKAARLRELAAERRQP